jgi:hypothetical protein
MKVATFARRLDRREEVVDRAQRVAARELRLRAHRRGDEDDRSVRGLLALPDQRGGLEAAQLRHVHVEQDHHELPREQLAQRLLARAGADHDAAHVLERRLERDQVLDPVVDEEDVEALFAGGHGVLNGAASGSGAR